MIAEATAPADARPRAPLWVGNEPVGEAFWDTLVDFEAGARDGRTLTDAEVQEVQERPFLVNAGPAQFTTCQDLVLWPTIVWDVNHYYADLGVSFRASREELKKAYQAKEGWKSQRLTYVLKQLLNPEIRAAYDATQIGNEFFDAYVAQYVKEQMLQDAVERTGRIPTIDERLDEIEEEFEEVDFEKYLNTEIRLDNEPDDVISRISFRWGYYMLRTSTFDPDKLQQWQGLLLKAPVPKPHELAVGLMAGSEAIKLMQIGFRTVAFLNENYKPDAYLAIQILLQTPEKLRYLND